jgi:hypothetical protein
VARLKGVPEPKEGLRLKRLDHRIRRSKRVGKVVLGGVVIVSMVFGAVLIQALLLALRGGRDNLVIRALVGLGLLAGLNVFSVLLIRRQHRTLDEAMEEMEEMVRGDLPL